MQNPSNQTNLVSLNQGLEFYQNFSTLVAVLKDHVENVSFKSHSYGITFVRNNVEPILSICNIEDLSITCTEITERYLVQFYKDGVPIWSTSYVGFNEPVFNDLITVIKSDYKMPDHLQNVLSTDE